MVAVHKVVVGREFSVGVPIMIEAAGRKKRPIGASNVSAVNEAMEYVVPEQKSSKVGRSAKKSKQNVSENARKAREFELVQNMERARIGQPRSGEGRSAV